MVASRRSFGGPYCSKRASCKRAIRGNGLFVVINSLFPRILILFEVVHPLF
ncbi:hypothetical protein M2447_000065 [Ereboglobus sp. PH5-10]|nr:hypothetical protein [Ereboglobus sp. PH5-10]